ncbi:hypothetical protein BDZ89DRAFT_969739, partial [Hymenopellis radicata]
CDDVDMYGKPRTDAACSWSQASKMRSAMTKGFGVDCGRGSVRWNSATGEGNPSLSLLIASYCRGLHRRKVQLHGETPTSARAVTEDTMRELFLRNMQALRSPPEDDWCGPLLRMCLQAIYSLSFVCLLRVDEVLKIQAHEISFNEESDGSTTLELFLSFRKTHQYGDIKPFIIRMFPEYMAHLCPVRAVAKWISHSQIKTGFIFRKMNKDHLPIILKQSPLTAEKFLEYFRNNLVDIQNDCLHSYGTHSFRRGGCQWLSVELRWPLRQICEYGGWSTDFSHLTIVKYLISWNDNHPMLYL